jgi:rod shape-determining protein MreC
MRNRRFIILMIIVIVFAAIIGFTLNNRNLSWPQKVLMDGSAAVQAWLYTPAAAVVGLFEDMTKLQDVYRENEELRKLAAQYVQDKNRFNSMEQENVRLKEALQFTETQKNINDYKYMIAQVVGVADEAYNQTIRINLGSKNGVQANMAVVTPDGLVGYVRTVTSYSANVTPLTALNAFSTEMKQYAVTVFGKERDSFGIVEQYDELAGTLEMSRIEDDDPIQVGDKVITSGKGNVFPQGIEVGTVIEIHRGDMGLTRKAIVVPAADFNHLTEVFVVSVPSLEMEEDDLALPDGAAEAGEK